MILQGAGIPRAEQGCAPAHSGLKLLSKWWNWQPVRDGLQFMRMAQAVHLVRWKNGDGAVARAAVGMVEHRMSWGTDCRYTSAGVDKRGWVDEDGLEEMLQFSVVGGRAALQKYCAGRPR